MLISCVYNVCICVCKGNHILYYYMVCPTCINLTLIHMEAEDFWFATKSSQ